MIRRSLKYLILFLLILLQTSNLINTIKLPGINVKPDLVLTYIVYISLSSSFIVAETAGFFTGLIMDILSSILIGINAFSLTVLSSLLNLFKTKLFIEKTFSVFIIVFFTVIIHRMLYFLLTVIFMHKIHFFKIFIKITLPEALYTAVAAIILFPIYNYFSVKK